MKPTWRAASCPRITTAARVGSWAATAAFRKHGDELVDERVRLGAIQAALDRGWGKATQHIEAEISVYDSLSFAEKKALLAAFDTLAGGEDGAAQPDEGVTCEFEREYWIKHFPEADPESLGGLSGGPVFVIRHSPSGVVSYEYAGLIYRMHEPTESLFIRQAQAIPLGWEVSG